MKRPMLAVAALFVVGVLLGETWPQPPMSLLTIALSVVGLGRLGQRALSRRHPKLRADLVVTSIADDGHTLEPSLLPLLGPRIILVQDCDKSPSRSARRRTCVRDWSNLGHVSFTRGAKVA